MCVWSVSLYVTLLCSSCDVFTSVLRVSFHACFHNCFLPPWHAPIGIAMLPPLNQHHPCKPLHQSLRAPQTLFRQHNPAACASRKSFDSQPHTQAGGFGMGGGFAFKASMVSLDRRNCRYCSCSPRSSAVEPVGMASPSAVSSAALDAASRQNATCPTLLGLNERWPVEASRLPCNMNARHRFRTRGLHTHQQHQQVCKCPTPAASSGDVSALTVLSSSRSVPGWLPGAESRVPESEDLQHQAHSISVLLV